MHDLFAVSCGSYTLLCSPHGLPEYLDIYTDRALLVEDLRSPDERAHYFLAVQDYWKTILVIMHDYDPRASIHPGALLIPETHILFVGAGEVLLAYRLDQPLQLWTDTNDWGFWGWQRHGDYVLMSAELELAAWDIHGNKLWSMFMEPPWTYEVKGNTVYADRMDEKLEFPIQTGSDKWRIRTKPKE